MPTAPDRTLLVLNEIRATLHAHSAQFVALNARLDNEFSEIRDRLQRLDESVFPYFGSVEAEIAHGPFSEAEIARIRHFFSMEPRWRGK